MWSLRQHRRSQVQSIIYWFVLTVLAGSSLTLVAAFGLALFADPFKGSLEITDVLVSNPLPHRWRILCYRTIGATRMLSKRQSNVGSEYSARGELATMPRALIQLCKPTASLETTGFDNCVVDARGLPFAAMCSRVLLASELSPQTASSTDGVLWLETPTVPDVFLDRRRWIPLRILWLGFIVDTSFWGSVVGVLAWGLVSGRRHYRRARGRCVTCNHYLQDAQVRCPECGRPRLRTASRPS